MESDPELEPEPSVATLGPLLTDAYYVVDADDRIVTYNTAFRMLFPRSEARALREMRCRDAGFLPNCRDGRCLREDCERQGTIRLDEVETTIGGQNLRLIISAGPVTLAGGRKGTMIILRDVTDEARIQAKYQRMMEEARERAARDEAVSKEMERQRRESIAQMVAGVAHEMNTPLGVANAAAATIVELVEQSELKKLGDAPVVGDEIKDLQQGVKLIQRNLLRVDDLIRKFRTLSVGQLVDTREDLDLGQAVRDALQLWSREAKKASLNIEVINQLTPGLRWTGYAGHLSQVVMALLANVKMHAYADGKGGNIEVNLASKAGPPDEFSVSVRDWGKGIPPDTMPNIFDPFFTTARVKGATGLGLSIALNIVSSIFGGTLRCASAPGEGSTFTATFSHCPPAAS